MQGGAKHVGKYLLLLSSFNYLMNNTASIGIPHVWNMDSIHIPNWSLTLKQKHVIFVSTCAGIITLLLLTIREVGQEIKWEKQQIQPNWLDCCSLPYPSWLMGKESYTNKLWSLSSHKYQSFTIVMVKCKFQKEIRKKRN